MWISQKVIGGAGKTPTAELTEVTGSSIMQGESDYRGVPFCAPWGVAYQPPNTARAVVVSTRQGNVCLGVLPDGKELQAGELMLYSLGGAEIYLKNSGEVVINGQVFAAKQEG